MLINKIKEALQTLSEHHTKKSLGDRSLYIGASDIGGCPRKVLLSKLYPQTSDLNQLIQQKRGHLTETILEEAFSEAGFNNVTKQVAVKYLKYDTLPVKAHIDFVFTSEASKTKAILEVKSPKNILPKAPYEAWIMQLYLQMGLLAEKHPGYKIKGAILLMGLNVGEIKVFNGYEHNPEIFEGLLNRSSVLWEQLEELRNNPDTDIKTEVSPLCGYCDFIANCPALQAEEIPELEDTAEQYLALKEQDKSIKASMQELSNKLSNISEEYGNIVAGNYIIKKVTRSRSSFNAKALTDYFEKNGGNTTANDFKTPTKYSFLDIKTIKN